ncbi:uncharacterized protein [Euwallacea fornicatus]|uniref:uncharacterized protein isoform X2 n=1 Tax=Euwallacea fornicatus TaxID=995702 RepID=UPI00338F7D7E
MVKLVIFCLFLSVCAYSSASYQLSTQNTDNVPSNTKDNPIATILFQSLMNLISDQLQAFKLKLRVVRFMASLYTNENLLLARDLIVYGIKLANLTLHVLPQSVEDPGYSWILPLIQIFNGSQETGGSVLDLSESGNEAEAQSEASSEYSTATNPPTFYNAPVKREPRNVVKGKLLVNESEPHVLKDKASNLHEDVLLQHRERLLALEKLINSRRK